MISGVDKIRILADILWTKYAKAKWLKLQLNRFYCQQLKYECTNESLISVRIQFELQIDQEVKNVLLDIHIRVASSR